MAFPRKWSEDLQRAVFVVVFDRGASARAAHDLATAGTLPQLEPGQPRLPAAPELPLKTVQDWCRHERARRKQLERARAAPAEVMGAAAGRLAAIHDREVTRAERRAARGQLEPGTIAKLARDAIEIARLARAVQTGKLPADPGDASGAAAGTSGDTASDAPRSWIEQLAAAPDNTNS
jgi:hypothetical protein